jgi:hypothetical protein
MLTAPRGVVLEPEKVAGLATIQKKNAPTASGPSKSAKTSRMGWRNFCIAPAYPAERATE